MLFRVALRISGELCHLEAAIFAFDRASLGAASQRPNNSLYIYRAPLALHLVKRT
jgi:hypothetical protein